MALRDQPEDACTVLDQRRTIVDVIQREARHPLPDLSIGRAEHLHPPRIAIDERKKRNGRALEFLGTYDPLPDPPKLVIKRDRIDAWIQQGAQLTDATRSLLRRAGKRAPAANEGAS